MDMVDGTVAHGRGVEVGFAAVHVLLADGCLFLKVPVVVVVDVADLLDGVVVVEVIGFRFLRGCHGVGFVVAVCQ